jgi:hypothetical protein
MKRNRDRPPLHEIDRIGWLVIGSVGPVDILRNSRSALPNSRLLSPRLPITNND